MRTSLSVAMTLALCVVAHGGDWPGWRGPAMDNHADPQVHIVKKWDLETGQNIVWKTRLPGRGHSTPAIAGDRIFLTTADEAAGTQSLLILHRSDGRIAHKIDLHRQTLPPRIHPNNSHASPSPLVIDNHVFVTFHTDDAIVLSKVSVAGRVVWQKRIAAFEPSQYQFGYGASPIRAGDAIIVAAEYDGPDSGIYAVTSERGDQVYRIDRPENLSFSTPAIATIGGRQQMVIAGADAVVAYDPATGRVLWRADAGTEAHCGTAVWNDRHVVVSGGNPQSKTWSVVADGSGRVAWTNPVVAYEQSQLAIRNHVLTIANSGAAYCHRIADGTEMWRGRALGAGVSASPLWVDGKVVAADERGKVVIFRASAERFESLAEIQTGDSIFASPVAVDDRLFIRTGVAMPEGRVEYLIAIGQ